MPNAARDFLLGNRMVRKGEAFEIPQGEEADFRENGLIEGEEPAPRVGQSIAGIDPAPLETAKPRVGAAKAGTEADAGSRGAGRGGGRAE